MNCNIPANPDISGAGVRAAIYVQNFLSFIPAFWALSDGIVTVEELKTVEKQSMTILITAFAILISSIVQAAGTFVLSDFHASIILSLSWMNNTNTFIYFLLYVGFKSHRDNEGAMVKPQLKAWFNHINDSMRCRSHTVPGDNEAAVTKGPLTHGEGEDPDLVEGRRPSKGLAGWMNSALTIFRHRIVLTLGSLHLTVMAVLGLWLWASPTRFEASQGIRTNGTAFASSDMLPVRCTHVSLVGVDVELLLPVLRHVSLVIYSFFLAPGLNMLIPAAFFLLVFVGSHDSRLDKFYALLSRLWVRICVNTLAIPMTASSQEELTDQLSDVADEKPNLIAVWIGLIILLLVDIVFLVDIEVALHHAKQQRHLSPGESDWTFGQTLALILLVLPLRDVVDYGAVQEQIRYDRARRATKTMKQAVLSGNSRSALKAAKYADNLCIRISDEFPSVISFAARMGNLDLARLMLSRSGVDVAALINLPDDSDFTPLGRAACNRDRPMVRLLLKHGADVKKAANHCLIHAAESGHESLARLALQHGAYVNWADSSGQTPLTCAARNGRKAIVKLLLAHGADVDQAEKDGKTPLILSVRDGHKPVVRCLLRHHADVNRADNDGQTPLHWAAFKGHDLIAALLLECGASANEAGICMRTPLMEAAFWGRTQVITVLLDSGADLEQADSVYGQTALFRAVAGEEELTVQLLLNRGADYTKIDNCGQTPYSFARRRGYLGLVKIFRDAQVRREPKSDIGPLPEPSRPRRQFTC